MVDYLPIAAMFVLAGLFAGVSFFASRLLAPQRPTPAKEGPYECGIVPEREPAERFPVRYMMGLQAFFTPAIFKREQSVATAEQRAAYEAAMNAYPQPRQLAELEAPAREKLRQRKLALAAKLGRAV